MKKYGLIGKTLSHSFSKSYFTARFIELGISEVCSYHNFELNTIDDFTTLIASEPDLAGLNVTIPYKEQIIPFLDHLDTIAEQTGAVNTIRIERNSEGKPVNLTGFNTDTTGFMKAIQPMLKPSHSGALILGSGGASKAVEWALHKLNLAVVKVSRTASENHLSYASLNREMISKYPVIVNTTPLGTFPETDKAPDIPFEFITSNNLLFDLVYNPAETKFMKLGMQYGAQVSNGLEMLKIQAEEAWKIWNAP